VKCRQLPLPAEFSRQGGSADRIPPPEHHEGRTRVPAAAIAQKVLKKLSEAWTGYFELRAKLREAPDKNQKPGLRRYRKNRKSRKRHFGLIPIKHLRSYAIDAKDISPRAPHEMGWQDLTV
jgi:hypothetical protein